MRRRIANTSFCIDVVIVDIAEAENNAFGVVDDVMRAALYNTTTLFM